MLKQEAPTLLPRPISKDDIARLFHTSPDTRPFDTSTSAWSRNEVAVFVRDLYLILTHKVGLGVIQVHGVIQQMRVHRYHYSWTLILKVFAHFHRLVTRLMQTCAVALRTQKHPWLVRGAHCRR